MEKKLLLSVKEAADSLGVGVTLMRALVSSGRVGSVQINTRRLVPNDALVEYIDYLKAGLEEIDEAN